MAGNVQFLGYIFVLRSPNRTANQIRRSYKNDEFDWPFDFVTVTRRYNQFLDLTPSPWAEIRHVFGFTFSWRAAPPVIV